MERVSMIRRIYLIPMLAVCLCAGHAVSQVPAPERDAVERVASPHVPTAAANEKKIAPRADIIPRTEIVGYFPQWGVYNRRYVPLDLVLSGAIKSLTQIDYAQGNIKDSACVVADPQADMDLIYKAEDSIDGKADDPNAPLRGNFHQLQLLRKLYPKLRIISLCALVHGALS
jgi:GH18 family chitinase